MTSSSERVPATASVAARPVTPLAWSLTELEPVCAVLVQTDAEAGVAAVDVEALQAQAYEEGLRAGFEEGRRQEAERLRGAHALLESVVTDVRAAELRWVAAARENLTVLATAIATHVIGRELRGDAQAVADLTRRALAEFPLDEPVRVRLHPHDLSTIAVIANGGGPIAIAPGREVRWIADPAIQPGGCIVEGRERMVDGRVDRALERIYRTLADD